MDLEPSQRRADSDPQDIAAAIEHLTRRVRLGLIALERVEAAASLGHIAAGHLTGRSSERALLGELQGSQPLDHRRDGAAAGARLAAILSPLSRREVVALGCEMVEAMLARIRRPWHQNYQRAAEILAALRSWIAGEATAADCQEAERALGQSHIDGRMHSARELALLVCQRDDRNSGAGLARVINASCSVANVEAYVAAMRASPKPSEAEAQAAGRAAALADGARQLDAVIALLLKETDEH